MAQQNNGRGKSWEAVETVTPLDQIMIAEEAAHDYSSQDGQLIQQSPIGVLGALLRFLVPDGKLSGVAARSIGYRVIMLAHHYGLDGVGDRGFAEIAKELKCSRSLLSLIAVNLSDELGMQKPRGGKTRSSRAVYKAAATAYHERAGHIMAHDKRVKTISQKTK